MAHQRRAQEAADLGGGLGGGLSEDIAVRAQRRRVVAAQDDVSHELVAEFRGRVGVPRLPVLELDLRAVLEYDVTVAPHALAADRDLEAGNVLDPERVAGGLE